jgi:Mn2+/Fe2+ NRAMP family transporter
MPATTPGGIVTYASAGAQFAYRTLFLMVLVTVALIVVQEMCSRLGVYTGEGLGGLIREQFSARAAFVAMLLLLIANAGLTVSEFAGGRCGDGDIRGLPKDLCAHSRPVRLGINGLGHLLACGASRSPRRASPPPRSAAADRWPQPERPPRRCGPSPARPAPALFGVGLLGASLLAASVVPLSTSYAVADAMGTVRSVTSRFRQARLFYGLFTLQIVIGAAAALAPSNLVALIINA